MFLAIAWIIQTILFLYLIYDLHRRVTFNQEYTVALGALLKIEAKDVIAVIEKADEFLENEE